MYRKVKQLGVHMQAGLETITRNRDIPAVVACQGSAFSLYFMDDLPTDWHDFAAHHDAVLDEVIRRGLIECGIYTFPAAVKQFSISCAHTHQDVERTLAAFEDVFRFSTYDLRESCSCRD
jgi:glutamate-1-semialdehyde 2,1-aminomutase